MISGSWWYGRFAEEITGFQWGTFLFPGNKLHPGSSGNLWVVPAARRPGTFTARVANPGAASTVQIRLGHPVTGRLLGTAAVPTTDDAYTYTTAALAAAAGRHDVYVVFTGPARLATLTLR